ncbi:hypothetical protein DBR06_SOUSAS1110036 [Sousa chinensis]|uniref:Uncharacterized protein n=1 Tax=Sousa chinensis TaxID=103600 RepID=A0A484GJH7_SOUCH|nr:hypothetical protein DBR06_SOUSAS1110036 [Sousa chinensis]
MNVRNTSRDVDGSMVPPERHPWLHCAINDAPTTRTRLLISSFGQTMNSSKDGSSKAISSAFVIHDACS